MLHIVKKFVLVLLLLVGTVKGEYEFNHSISSLPGYLIEWTITGDEIELRLTAPTTGWVGFGISESGGMIGGDEFVAHVDDTTGAVMSNDYHSTVQDFSTPPVLDTCNDWVVVSGMQTTQKTIITVKRKLDTNDTQDWPILNESMATRVMAAYGSSDTFSYHGSSQRATTKIDFFDEMQSPDTALAAFASDPSVSTFTILNDNYTVPSVKTTYYKACVNVAVSTSHAIAFEHILVDASKPYTVHHFIMRAHRSSDCNDAIPDQVWGWAPGIDVLIFPSVAGVRIGSSGDANTYVSLEMETHFDNPTFAANEIDNSGVRVYYTSNLRQHDVGVMILGDGMVDAGGTLIPSGWNTYQFDCPTNCYANNNGGTEVTVLDVNHHMHGSGRSMRTRLVDGSTIYKEFVTNFFDFSFQDYIRTEPFQFRPGSGAYVECVYESSGEAFGLGSEDEMCMTFLTYYPASATDARFCGLDANGILGPCGTSAIAAHNFHGTIAPNLSWQTFSDAGSVCQDVPEAGSTTEKVSTTTEALSTSAPSPVQTTSAPSPVQTTSAPSPVQTTSAPSPDASESKSDGDDMGLIIVIACIAVTIAVIALITTMYMCQKRTTSKRKKTTTKKTELVEATSSRLDAPDVAHEL